MSRWNLVAAVLATPGPIVVTSHVNPDGDALGSELALAAWLRAAGRTVRIINADPPGSRYAFLDPRGECEIYTPAVHDPILVSAAVAVILDVGRWDRIGAVGPIVAGGSARALCIDHHPAEALPHVEASVIDTGAAATGELVFELITESGGEIDAAIARALYVAIMTDTGSFRYANTSARTHAVVSELLRHPLDTAGLYEAVYGRNSAAKLRLMGEALAGMEQRSAGRIALLSVTQEALRRCGAQSSDTEGFAEMGRTLETAWVAAVLTEQPDGRIKISLRSRGPLDVGKIAAQLGGGGHPGAAGAVVPGPLSQARERLATTLEAALSGTTA